MTHAAPSTNVAGPPAHPPATPRLRRAATSDLAAIEALLQENGLPLAGVGEALDGFIVAEDGAAIVGVAGLEVRDRWALLRSVAVAAPWRGRGLGRALVDRMIAEADARSLESIHLLTTTADRYFPSFGFTNVSRDEVPGPLRATDEFTTACPASATVMRLACRRPRDSDGR